MRKQEFTFEGSSAMPCTLHAVLWLPEYQNVDYVIQITHGMTEHMGRYETFANAFTQRGVAVAGFDLRGHGKNSGVEGCASFGENGWDAALEDVRIFYEILREKFPDAKHYMFGFSLGSFLLREYFMKYEHVKISGAIIMGTGHQPALVLNAIIGIMKGEIKKVCRRFISN